MRSTLFMPLESAKCYLKANRNKKVLIFTDKPIQQDWLSRLFSKPKHHTATFSLLTFPLTNPNGIREALLPHVSLDDSEHGDNQCWIGTLKTFIDEIVEMVRAVSGDDSLSFNEALDRAGFDLSYESFVRCAFSIDGKPASFSRTRRFLNINSLEDTKRSSVAENYQYIAMQISALFQSHKERLQSPQLVHLNHDLLQKYDAILMIIDDNYSNYIQLKDASILLNMSLIDILTSVKTR